MVKGLDIFREYFSAYSEQYVLIGGAACDISFVENNTDFRATRDFDMVLIVEAQTKEFGERFWEFIHDGKYQNRAKGNGDAQFYRFDKPQMQGYPAMIELFSRTNMILEDDALLTPIHIDDSVSSLSAILLDDAYYEALLLGRDVINGVSVLRPTWLIPFKAKAWLDMSKRIERGEHCDSRDIKKHRNDILRITSELVLVPCEMPEKVKMDMQEFIERLEITEAGLKNLNITGVHKDEIIKVLKDTYYLS